MFSFLGRGRRRGSLLEGVVQEKEHECAVDRRVKVLV